MTEIRVLNETLRRYSHTKASKETSEMSHVPQVEILVYTEVEN